MLFKVVTLCGCQTLLAVADLSSKVADPDGDLSLEMGGFNIDRSRDIVVDGDDSKLIP